MSNLLLDAVTGDKNSHKNLACSNLPYIQKMWHSESVKNTKAISQGMLSYKYANHPISCAPTKSDQRSCCSFLFSFFSHKSELQIKDDIEDNSKIIFLISQRKPML